MFLRPQFSRFLESGRGIEWRLRRSSLRSFGDDDRVLHVGGCRFRFGNCENAGGLSVRFRCIVGGALHRGGVCALGFLFGELTQLRLGSIGIRCASSVSAAI